MTSGNLGLFVGEVFPDHPLSKGPPFLLPQAHPPSSAYFFSMASPTITIPPCLSICIVPALPLEYTYPKDTVLHSLPCLQHL